MNNKEKKRAIRTFTGLTFAIVFIGLGFWFNKAHQQESVEQFKNGGIMWYFFGGFTIQMIGIMIQFCFLFSQWVDDAIDYHIKRVFGDS